jgi:hypothetical protein
MATLKDTVILGKLSVLEGIYSRKTISGTEGKFDYLTAGGIFSVDVGAEEIYLGPNDEVTVYDGLVQINNGELDCSYGALTIKQLYAPINSSDTDNYGLGTSGQILKSNGSNAHWSSVYLPYQYLYRYHFQVSNTSTTTHNTAYFSLDEYSNDSPKSSWTYAQVVAALTKRGFTGTSSLLPASGSATGNPVSAVYATNGYVYYVYTSSSGAKYTGYYQNPYTVSVKIETVTSALR